MSIVLPIASGKGGVGKSVLAANLGLALSLEGRTVLLVDLDLGASNLHTCLGIRNKHAGLGSLLWKQENSLDELIVESDYERLWFIPGDGLMPGTANLDWFSKRRILKGLRNLSADFVILDLGAGSSYNVVDFFLASSEGFLVIKPEITSVLNAYSFLKTAMFRLVQRSFKEGGEGRAMLRDFVAVKTEGEGRCFIEFARALAQRFPSEGRALAATLAAFKPRVVMNQGRHPDDAGLGYRLRDISKKNLGLAPDFAAFLLEDPALPRSVAARRPLIDVEPEAPFARGVAALARRLARSPSLPAPEFPGDELGRLALEALSDSGRADDPRPMV